MGAFRRSPAGDYDGHSFADCAPEELVPRDNEAMQITYCDAIRDRLYDAVRHLYPGLTLDVIFTGDERWLGMEEAPG